MAEVELELKDEELLDFDGSEYEFGSDEELGEDNINWQLSEEGTNPVVQVGNDEPAAKVEMVEVERNGNGVPNTGPQGAESGEIQEDEKGDEVLMRPDRSSALDKEKSSGRARVQENCRIRKHVTKSELEDGELVDMAAMVNSKKQTEHGVVKDLKRARKYSNETMVLQQLELAELRVNRTYMCGLGKCGEQRDLPDREAERNADIRHDRKRRKDHYDYERHQYRKEGYETSRMGRHDRSHGGDRHHDRFGGFPDPRSRGGPRSSHSQHFGASRPNLSPAIMGPGRPLRPDMNPHIPYRPSTTGLQASLGMFSPAQLQELLAQEHILRSQQMLARLGIRPQMHGPVAAQALQPLVGPNFLRHIPLLQPPGSDLVSQVNFLGPLDSSGRGPRSNFAAGRGAGILGGVFGLMAGQVIRPHAGTERPSSIVNEALPLAAGRGQPRPVSVPQGVSSGAEQGSVNPAVSGRGMSAVQGNGGSASKPASNSTPGIKTAVNAQQDLRTKQAHQDVDKRTDKDSHAKSRSRTTSSAISNVGRGNKDSVLSNAAPSKGNEAGSNTGNVIQLGGPMHKSRVLTVSGLLENTPMSTVVEAFEKQGKIQDFRKNHRGDVFTITFSNVQEALSAKRHLHRSILGGRQITVEYAL